MARSAEALRRRAEKRGRTVEEQRKIDGEAYKQKQLDQQKEQLQQADVRLQEPGAWLCPACGNNNFASRRSCHSKTCRQRQPADAAQQVAVSPKSPKKKQHIGASASASSSWNIPTADESLLAANQLLRTRYLESQGQGMTPEEQERAKILIARDKRKQEKKEQKKKKVPSSAAKAVKTKKTTATSSSSSSSPPSKSMPANTAAGGSGSGKKEDKKGIIKRYLEEDGKESMTPEEQERAKILVARQERRAKRRKVEDNVDKKKSKTGQIVARRRS